MYYTFLTDRRLIECSADDAAVFLQGLVSNDVTHLREEAAVYAALLTPQGKFLHDFFLMKWRESILIDCGADSLSDLLARLTMYKLRSKVVIEAKEQMGIVAIWDGKTSLPFDSCPLTSTFPDPRLPQLGWRMVGDSAAIRAWCEGQGMQAADDAAYDRMRLELGVPDGARDMVREKSLLLEFAFEDLHGVDFKKGCYVGQEVTARSKYRGQVRRFIYQTRAVSDLPPSGTPVVLDGLPAGELRSVQGSIGLALLNVAMAEKALAQAKDFYAGNVAFKALLPAWVSHPPKALIIAE